MQPFTKIDSSNIGLITLDNGRPKVIQRKKPQKKSKISDEDWEKNFRLLIQEAYSDNSWSRPAPLKQVASLGNAR